MTWLAKGVKHGHCETYLGHPSEWIYAHKVSMGQRDGSGWGGVGWGKGIYHSLG